LTPETKAAQHSEQVSGAGNRIIQDAKASEGTGQAPVILLTEIHPRNGHRSLVIPFSSEAAKNTNIVHLVEAFCGSVEKSARKKLHVVLSTPEPILAVTNERITIPELRKEIEDFEDARRAKQ
jgi:hypothetical protein